MLLRIDLALDSSYRDQLATRVCVFICLFCCRHWLFLCRISPRTELTAFTGRKNMTIVKCPVKRTVIQRKKKRRRTKMSNPRHVS